MWSLEWAKLENTHARSYCSINSCNYDPFPHAWTQKYLIRIQNNTLEGHSFWSLNEYHNQHWNSLPCPIHSLCAGFKVSSFNYLTHPCDSSSRLYMQFVRVYEKENLTNHISKYFSVTENSLICGATFKLYYTWRKIFGRCVSF